MNRRGGLRDGFIGDDAGIGAGLCLLVFGLSDGHPYSNDGCDG